MAVKTLRIQVLLEPILVEKLKQVAKEKKEPFFNESRLIRLAIIKFLDYEDKISITIHIMKQQIEQLKSENEQLHEHNAVATLERDKLIKHFKLIEIENEQLKKKYVK